MPLDKLTPLISSVAELGTQIHSLTLKKIVSYNDSDWVDFSPLTTLSNLTAANLQFCCGDLTFLKQFKRLKNLTLEELSSIHHIDLEISSIELEDLRIGLCLQSYYFVEQTGALDAIINPSRLTKLSLCLDVTMPSLQQFTNLKDLSLQRTGPFNVFQFTYLEALHLNFISADLSVVGQQSLLTRLIMEGVQSGLHDLQQISSLTNLRVLHMVYTPIVYEGTFEFLSRLTRLEEFKIHDITDDEPDLQYLNSSKLTLLMANI